MRNRNFFTTMIILIFITCIPVIPAAQDISSSLSMREIMANPPIEGNRPSRAGFSPDGKHITFFWSDIDKDSVSHFWITPSGKSKPEILLEKLKGTHYWDQDSKYLYYIEKKGLYKIDIKTKQKIKVSTSASLPSRFTLSHDKNHILFSRKGIWIYNTADDELTQLTMNSGSRMLWSPDDKYIAYLYKRNIHILNVITKQNQKITSLPEESKDSQAKRISRFKWSPNSNYVSFSTRKSTVEDRKIVVPHYLPEYVRTRPARNSFAGDPPSEAKAGVYSLKGKTINWLDLGEEKKFYLFGTFWSPDSRTILLNIQSGDFHNRYLVLAKPEDSATSILDSENDPAWISSLSNMINWTKGSKSILFTSERDGYNHIYNLNLKKKSVKQLTSGNWEVSSCRLLPDSQNVIFSSTEVTPSERHFYRLDINNGERKKLKTETGYNSSMSLSKDGSKILYRHANYARPYDYYVIGSNPSDKPSRITNSLPEGFKKVNWILPEYITFPNIDDNVTVRALLFNPPKLDKTRKYPVILFIHGAGYLQNVTKNWTPYQREYKFHHRMLHKGYIVLDIDYRGSAGYGRDFRTGVYLHMGGKDLRDLVSGIEYLKTLGYADLDNVGCYGGSYGGFLTLMALCLEPDYFMCGAALRSVTDWKNYNAYYTNQRLGYPKDNPEAYKKSSPITFAEKLTRPLLLMHGLVDDNVFAQDSFQFAEKLIKAGIDFEFMVYPSQRHGFTDPESWVDEYNRIEKLFEKHLK